MLEQKTVGKTQPAYEYENNWQSLFTLIDLTPFRLTLLEASGKKLRSEEIALHEVVLNASINSYTL